MGINADKGQQWQTDIATSVDFFNKWFLTFAPQAFRDTRVRTTEAVKEMLKRTDDMRNIDSDVLKDAPQVLRTLRMSTAPPIARDRLIGLADVNKNLVKVMEDGLKTAPSVHLPPRMNATELTQNFDRITETIVPLLDTGVFPWLATGEATTEEERCRASTIVADRLCGSLADPIIRNAQEKRQLQEIGRYLDGKGYRQQAHPTDKPIQEMTHGTYSFRMNVRTKSFNVPVDCVIQRKTPRATVLPILIEAKSAGDFTNVNKRRKEESDKLTHLRETYGNDIEFILFLCGYFDEGYLQYEARVGIDWVWEHRIGDLDQLGL